MQDRSSWANWARNQECAPHSIRRPTTEDELVRLVVDAGNAGQRVKCAGAGPSFTPIACTDGGMFDPSGYDRVPAHDPATTRVTVQAGIPLRKLCEVLDRRGRAIENMGDIAYQSIAGATSTATHGTGWEFGNLSTRIVGMRIVAAD